MNVPNVQSGIENNILRSQVNTQRTFYTFKNRTHRTVDLIWVNFSGGLEYMRTLKPDEFVDVNTFRTHVWIAVDSQLKLRMNIENRSIFVCPGLIVRNRSEPILRKTLNIMLPLRSLKYTVMLNLFEKNLIRSYDDVRTLELPRTLERNLCETLEQIEKLKSLKLKFPIVPVSTT